MKHYVTMLLFLTILFSCGQSDTKQKELELKERELELKDLTKDTIKESPIKTSEIKTFVKVKLFFKTFGTDEEGNTIKSEVYERKEFQKERKYTYCYDSEEFNKLILEGNGIDISLIVFEGSIIKFQKTQIDLGNQFTLTKSIFNLAEAGGNKSYKVVIKQGEIILFQGKIDSQGCM